MGNRKIKILDFLNRLKTARYKGLIIYFPNGKDLTSIGKKLADKTDSKYIDLLELLSEKKEYFKDIFATDPLKWIRNLILSDYTGELFIVDNTDVAISVFKYSGVMEDFLSAVSYLENGPGLCFLIHRDESIVDYFNKHSERHPEQPTAIDGINIKIKQ